MTKLLYLENFTQPETAAKIVDVLKDREGDVAAKDAPLQLHFRGQTSKKLPEFCGWVSNPFHSGSSPEAIEMISKCHRK